MAYHRILTADAEARTGVCSVCGSVELAKNGDRWRCAIGSRQSTKAWKRKHPDKVEAQRNRWRGKKGPAPHELIDKDFGLLFGECRSCGPNMLIRRHGRGWVCSATGGCDCLHEPNWVYRGTEPTGPVAVLCELCCYALARGFVQQGLMEPVLELTWSPNRVAWDTAVWELESA